MNRKKVFGIGAAVLFVLSALSVIPVTGCTIKKDISQSYQPEKNWMNTDFEFVEYHGEEIIKPNPKTVYYDPDSVIVVSVEDKLNLVTDYILRTTGCNLLDTIPELFAGLFDLNGMSIEKFTSLVEDNSMISYIEPNVIHQTSFTPNDPLYDHQSNLKLIGCPSAWDKTRGSTSVTVAVIDSGIDYDHPDIKPNYPSWSRKNDYDFINNDNDPKDDNGHGTHCAGIIAGKINNEQGIAGVANIRLLALKAFSFEGKGTTWPICKALVYAAKKQVDVISMSFGAYFPSALESLACNFAHLFNIVLVGAAGNSGIPVACFPAGFLSVISVGAINKEKKKPSWSNYGPLIELWAPGVKILSTMPTYNVFLNKYGYSKNYDYLDGTSMACPHVAGAAALYIAKHGTISTMVRDALDSTAESHSNLDGFGIVRADRALTKTRTKSIEKQSDIRLEITTDDTSYTWRKEKVNITISLTNTGADNYYLEFPTTQLYDIKIKAPLGFNIYKWSDGKTFAQTITKIELKQGETINWKIQWNQKGRLFRFLPVYHFFLPGKYEITAEIPLKNNPLTEKTAIQLKL